MSKETYLVESLTRDLVARLMEERSLSMQQALDIVYTSKAFQALINLESGLYFQSSVYLYDILEEELNSEKQAVVSTESDVKVKKQD